VVLLRLPVAVAIACRCGGCIDVYRNVRGGGKMLRIAIALGLKKINCLLNVAFVVGRKGRKHVEAERVRGREMDGEK